MRYMIPVILGALAACASAPAVTPSATDDEAIVVALLERIRTGMVEGGALSGDVDFVVDPDWPVAPDMDTSSELADRTSDSLARIARAAGVRIGSRDDHYECGEQRPPTCWMRNADAVIAVGKPRIDGDTARVGVALVHRSEVLRDPRQAFRMWSQYGLVREETGWRVLGTSSTIVQ